MRRVVYRLCACVLVVQALVACGASARAKALTVTFAGVNGARDGFIAWDDLHQQELVAAAMSRREGEAALGGYRTQRALVVGAFELAYQALAAAALAKDDLTMQIVLGRVEHLYASLRGLMGSAAPKPSS